MSSPAIAPVSDALAAASKARFWDRIARKYAADPIADMAGYEATLQRVQGLLAPQQDVLEIGCGTGSTALRLALFTRSMLATDLDAALQQAVLALRPGGLLISKTPCLAEMNPLIPYLAVPLMRAIGKAPAVLCFDEHRLTSAMAQQGLHIVCTERHGRRGKDIRAFVLARKPG